MKYDIKEERQSEEEYWQLFVSRVTAGTFTPQCTHKPATVVHTLEGSCDPSPPCT